MRLLLGGALAAVAIAACASNQRAQQMPASAAPQASPEHDEITRLSHQIATESDEQNRANSAQPLPQPQPQPQPMNGGNAPECTRSAASTCTQTCTLSDSICDNAKKICDLAKQLPGDAWADQKCSDGTTTCDQAKAICCACS